jgi:hypothetical protein
MSSVRNWATLYDWRGLVCEFGSVVGFNGRYGTLCFVNVKASSVTKHPGASNARECFCWLITLRFMARQTLLRRKHLVTLAAAKNRSSIFTRVTKRLKNTFGKPHAPFFELAIHNALEETSATGVVE